jgi:hypothetical protein
VAEQTNLSKRERHKARRDQKVEAQRAAITRARRARMLTFMVVFALVVGAVGILVQRNAAQRAASEAQRAEVSARLGELGCSEITQLPEAGRSHLAPAQLAANAPEALYLERPGTSGPHMGQVVLTGVYDEVVDERLVVHNLEHGYVAYWYGPDAEPAQVDALKQWARERIDGGYPMVVVAESPAPLPDGANFATTAWTFRQLCTTFDPQVAQVFLDDHHDSPDVPEPNASAHTDPTQAGVIDPAAQDGPLLFPPLGDTGVTDGPAMPDPNASGAAPTGG